MRISPLLLRNLPSGMTPSKIKMRMMSRIVSSVVSLQKCMSRQALRSGDDWLTHDEKDCYAIKSKERMGHHAPFKTFARLKGYGRNHPTTLRTTSATDATPK